MKYEKGLKIAIVGHALSGKDAVANYISKKYGFEHASTGDLVRRYISDNNLGIPTRDLMQKIGNELREKQGAGCLIDIALKVQKEDSNIVVSGLRAMGEIACFKDVDGIIIGVDAPIEDRYERAVKRRRATDEVSFEEFKKQEECESTAECHHHQAIDKVMKMADYTIMNDGSLEDLYSKIDEIIAPLQNKI